MDITETIEILDLSEEIKRILDDNKIALMKDLWLLKRPDLKQMGLSDMQIKQIIIKMQLNGIDLNTKMYNKTISRREKNDNSEIG